MDQGAVVIVVFACIVLGAVAIHLLRRLSKRARRRRRDDLFHP
jgi:hypothetical protein